MSKLQLIIFSPAIILFGAILFRKYADRANRIADLLFPSLALCFLFLLFTADYGSLSILHFGQNLNLEFGLDKINKLFVILLGAVWLGFACYLPQYFILSGEKKCYQFNILCGVVIYFLSLIVLSKNLITVLLFYQLLAFVTYIFANYFSVKAGQKAAHNFGFFTLLAPIFLFFATSIIYKTVGTLQFTAGGVFVSENINLLKYVIIFCFCILALGAIAFAPLYLLYSNLYYLSAPVLLVILLFGLGLGNLLILFKIINYIFGANLFFTYFEKINYQNLLTVVIGFNLLIPALLAALSKNLKQTLIFLFFNQLIWMIFVFLIVGFSPYKMTTSLFSFVLGFFVIFLAIGNINVYLLNSGEKNLNGAFHKLRLTIIGLILGLLNITGLAPTIGGMEKYLALKQILLDHNLIAFAVLLINTILLLVISIRIIYPMLEFPGQNQNPKHHEVAKDIESNLSLILPILIVGLIMALLLFIKLT